MTRPIAWLALAIVVAVPVSLIAGSLLAVQAAANTQLSKATGSPFAATALQLCVGAGLLTLPRDGLRSP